MNHLADLHSHSTASDGQFSPAELVRLAKASGVELLALTDHDTMDGTGEAIEAARQLSGIQVLRGVELGASEHRYLHIVGLNVSDGENALTEMCRKLRESRGQRMFRLIRFLEERGVIITRQEVEAQAGRAAVARPHFARVMVRKGYVRTIQEAFDRYLDTPEYQHIERMKFSAPECIRAIHDAGGKAVLAHPYQLQYTHSQMDALLTRLKESGLDGIEAYYRRHTPEQVAEYLDFARKYRLHLSAAGDFHGPQVHPGDCFHPVEIETDWIFRP